MILRRKRKPLPRPNVLRVVLDLDNGKRLEMFTEVIDARLNEAIRGIVGSRVVAINVSWATPAEVSP